MDFILGVIFFVLIVGIPVLVMYGLFKLLKMLFKGKKKKDVEPRFNSIDDLLTTNIREFHPEMYEKGETEVNGSGTIIQNYSHRFDPSEEARVFREVNVKVMENGGRNFIFTTRRPNDYHLNNFKFLVNNLFSIYGKDDSGRGAFTQEEGEDIEYGGYMISRRWTKDPNRTSLMLDLDEEEGISMTIWTKVEAAKTEPV